MPSVQPRPAQAPARKAKEELKPKLVTLREQIKGLTQICETRMQEVLSSGKTAFLVDMFRIPDFPVFCKSAS